MVSTARPGDSAGRVASGRATAALIVVCATTGIARANIEIGAMGGAHVFSDTSELGTTDGPNAPSQRNSGLLGVRVGGFLGLIGLEAELGVIPTEARQAKFGVTDVTYRCHVVVQLRGRDPADAVIPFLLAGVGGYTVVASSNGSFKTDPETNIEPDTDPGFYGGAGVKVRLGASAGLRLDGRVIVMPSSENTIPADPTSRSQTLDFEAMGSVYFELGRTTPVAAPPPLPNQESDADADGIGAALDRCPDEAEDKDGFQDDDGCPDPDDDFDGVADGADRCPTATEDKDGFQDDDGCPEADNDTDGIADALDRCPLEPEDKDGFQDADGCPDPDNDGDGVLDPSDACLDQLETKNGFEDTDGCPDELPANAKLLEGVLPKVAFKVFATNFALGTTKQLDAVVIALLQHPEIRLEIHVHTDDELVTRGLYADNQELSQARADAIVAYLVAKGVATERLIAKGFGEARPAVSPAGLSGAKLKAVRAMNRRVELHPISPLS